MAQFSKTLKKYGIDRITAVHSFLVVKQLPEKFNTRMLGDVTGCTGSWSLINKWKIKGLVKKAGPKFYTLTVKGKEALKACAQHVKTMEAVPATTKSKLPSQEFTLKALEEYTARIKKEINRRYRKVQTHERAIEKRNQQIDQLNTEIQHLLGGQSAPDWAKIGNDEVTVIE